MLVTSVSDFPRKKQLGRHEQTEGWEEGPRKQEGHEGQSGQQRRDGKRGETASTGTHEEKRLEAKRRQQEAKRRAQEEDRLRHHADRILRADDRGAFGQDDLDTSWSPDDEEGLGSMEEAALTDKESELDQPQRQAEEREVEPKKKTEPGDPSKWALPERVDFPFLRPICECNPDRHPWCAKPGTEWAEHRVPRRLRAKIEAREKVRAARLPNLDIRLEGEAAEKARREQERKEGATG